MGSGQLPPAWLGKPRGLLKHNVELSAKTFLYAPLVVVDVVRQYLPGVPLLRRRAGDHVLVGVFVDPVRSHLSPLLEGRG